MAGNRQVVIATLPDGPLRVEHFRMLDGDIPTPAPGEVLCRTILASIDPAQRVWMIPHGYRAEHPEMALDDGAVAPNEEPAEEDIVDVTRRGGLAGIRRHPGRVGEAD